MTAATVPAARTASTMPARLRARTLSTGRLTPNGPRPVVENDAYAAFARRILRAYARRIATGDIESLTLMTRLADDIDTAIRSAVTGLRDFGYSWADIGSRLGVTRQAAQQRWGSPAIGTAATVPLIPGPHRARGWEHPPTTPQPSITWADFLAAERQHTATGCCSHPIRLRGRIDAIDLATGELRPVYDTAAEPGGVLLTACGNRRETVCPRLLGGLQARRPPARPRRPVRRQGHPRDDRGASVRVRHPHRPLVRPGPRPPDARQDRPALPTPPRRATQRRCPHGRDISCPRRHADTIPGSDGRCAATATTTPPPSCSTPTRGTCGAGSPPTCPATSPASPGSPSSRSATSCAIRYVKVAEYQARGVVHFHAIIRLDAPGDTASHPARSSPPRCCATPSPRPPPPSPSPPPPPRPPAITLRFGAQTDARPVRHGPDLPGTGHALSGPGRRQLHRQVRHQSPRRPRHPRPAAPLPADLDACAAPRHYQQMITTAWKLGGGSQPRPTRLCKWAHMLGYGGHFLTKSRRYSVTFGQLRRARTEHRRPPAPPRRRTRPLGPPPRRHHRPGPAHLDLRRNRLHHHPRRRARARLRRPLPAPPHRPPPPPDPSSPSLKE